jgi:hypothetical protein
MIVQYFAELNPGGRFDFDPKIDQDAEGYDPAIHDRMKAAITGLVECRPDATLVKWWLADEDGTVIEEGTTLPVD